MRTDLLHRRYILATSLFALAAGVTTPMPAQSQTLPRLTPIASLAPDPTDCRPNDPPFRFARHLEVQNDTALVAMPSGACAGKVLVFSRNRAGEWARTGSIESPQPYPDDGFANGLKLKGDIALVPSLKGYHVYKRTCHGWRATQFVRPLRGENLSIEAAFENGIVAIGGATGSSGTSDPHGFVYLYRVTSAKTLVRIAKISASDAAPGDNFGLRLALSPSADTLVVASGSPQDSWNGAVYIFKRQGDRWVEQQKLRPAQSGLFGDGLAVDKDTLIVGATSEGDNGHGAVYVFRKTGNRWEQVQRVEPTLAEWPNDLFGFGNAIAMDATHVVIGAHYSSIGATFVYRRTQTGLVPEAVATAGGGLGEDVALRGRTIFAGAPWQDVVWLFDRGY